MFRAVRRATLSSGEYMTGEVRAGSSRALARLRSSVRDWFALAGFIAALIGWQPVAAQTPAHPQAASLEHDCIIEPDQIVRLASPVVGVISRIDVDRGDMVHKGQVLAAIDDRVEIATLALARARAANDSAIKIAEARLVFLRRKHDRIAELQSRSIKSLADLQEAEAETLVAEQQLREARVNHELARLEVQRADELVQQRSLRSPVDGVVVERLLVPGEYRNEQSPILTLARIDQLRVEVVVPTSRYGEIKVGSRAQVRPEAPIGGTHVATVTVVDRVLDAASDTFGVRLALANPGLALPSGIRCRVAFEPAASDGRPPLNRDSLTARE